MSVAKLTEAPVCSIRVSASPTSSAEPPQLPATMVVTPMRTKFSARGCSAEIVGVGVDVDESRCDDQIGGVDGLAAVARIDLADGGNSARGNRDVRPALRRAGAVHDSPADDDHVIPRSRDWSLGKGGQE